MAFFHTPWTENAMTQKTEKSTTQVLEPSGDSTLRFTWQASNRTVKERLKIGKSFRSKTRIGTALQSDSRQGMARPMSQGTVVRFPNATCYAEQESHSSFSVAEARLKGEKPTSQSSRLGKSLGSVSSSKTPLAKRNTRMSNV